MKFALSMPDSGCSADAVGAVASKLGFDGVALDFSAAIPDILQLEGIAIACLSGCGIDSPRVRELIDLAGRAGVPLVKIAESGAVQPRTNRANLATDLGDRLLPLADHAADRNVTLALDNSRSLRTAREIWAILDRCNHPSLGCCLDLLTSAILAESPQVVVPMLNSRIVYVELCDVRNLAEPTIHCDPGQGVVPIRTTLSRLRGIGYTGWAAVSGLGSSQVADSRDSSAIKLLREWDQPAGRAKAKPKTAK